MVYIEMIEQNIVILKNIGKKFALQENLMIKINIKRTFFYIT